MKIDEFMDTIKQMENFYGKEMTDEQKRIWFENLKVMNIERFRYIAVNLYKTSKFMPKLSDIFDLNISIGSINKKVESNKTDCKKCGNTGYIVYKKIIKNANCNIEYNYGAICNCNRKKQYKGWELSDVRYRSKYYTPLAIELSI